MGNELEYEFWSDDKHATSSTGIPRPKRGGRSHGDTQPIPRPAAMVLGGEESADDYSVTSQPTRPRRGPINPFKARLGALCAIGLLATPVAFAIRGSGRTVELTSAIVNATMAPSAQPTQTVVQIAEVALAAEPARTEAIATLVPEPTMVVTPIPAVVETTIAAPAITALAAPEPTSPAPAATYPPAPAAPEAIIAAEPPVQTNPVAAPTTAPIVASEPPATAAPATTVPAAKLTNPATCAKTYVVVKRDYWIRIAKKLTVSLDNLLDVNNADVSSALFPGRTICAPNNAVSPTTAPPVTQPTTKPPAGTNPPPATTAPAPPPPTATTVPRPANTYTAAQVQQIIREVWPDDLEEKAIAIAWRESNHIPTVRNYCCFGLFQIYYTVHKTWLSAMGITSSSQLWDPRVNATAAFALYQRAGGWGPWGG